MTTSARKNICFMETRSKKWTQHRLFPRHWTIGLTSQADHIFLNTGGIVFNNQSTKGRVACRSRRCLLGETALSSTRPRRFCDTRCWKKAPDKDQGEDLQHSCNTDGSVLVTKSRTCWCCVFSLQQFRRQHLGVWSGKQAVCVLRILEFLKKTWYLTLYWIVLENLLIFRVQNSYWVKIIADFCACLHWLGV